MRDMHPLERLVDLVALLLETRRPLTFEDIRSAMPEAYGQEDDAAAKRMFERDKDTLRDIGVPVELEPTDAWDTDRGYRIRKDRYYLPEIDFTPDEVWALFVAAHAPGADDDARLAFRKLTTGAESNVLAQVAERAPAPGFDASGPHLGAVAAALAGRRAVAFSYRPLKGRSGKRTVDPYALLFRSGNWYLVGMDRARKDVRAYRLSRFASGVREVGEASAPPEGFDARAHVEAGPWGLGRPEATARVRFHSRVAWMAAASARGARTVDAGEPGGWVTMEVPAALTDQFVSWVLSFGPDAVVEAPADIRGEVVARLRELASVGSG